MGSATASSPRRPVPVASLGSRPTPPDPRFEAWGLLPDGEAILTPTSRVWPVRHAGRPAVLKVALVPEEQAGNRFLAWWDGCGAATVYRCDEQAALMERATGRGDLAAMARRGGTHDEEAGRILARAAVRLHARSVETPAPCPTPEPGSALAPPSSPAPESGPLLAPSPGSAPCPPPPVPLTSWFADLFAHAEDVGGFYRRAADLAAGLLEDQREVAVLHGDVHHGNVLDFGPRGWLAIDPKGLVGDRAFDFANILCNPDPSVCARRGRTARLLAAVADEAGLDPGRLARWTVAWCALSAAWIEREPGTTPGNTASFAASTLAVGRQVEDLLP